MAQESTRLLPRAQRILLALPGSSGWAQVGSCSWTWRWTGWSALGLPGILLLAWPAWGLGVRLQEKG